MGITPRLDPYLKLLVTGEPGCGKTTALGAVVERLRGDVPMSGFLTEEVRVEGRRRGFEGLTLDGRRFPLADRKGKSRLRVGPYAVELDGLNEVGVPALVPSAETRLVVLDEVGKMEALSDAFRRQVEALLDGDVPLLASIAAHGVGWIKRVRRDPRVTLLRLRAGGSRAMADEIVRRLRSAGVR